MRKKIVWFLLTAIFFSCNETKDCLINYDWVYYKNGKLSGAWKFLKDGTFSSSNITFGGMSSWGNWTLTNEGDISIIYTKSTRGIPKNQIIKMASCDQLIVGDTVYLKE